MINKRKIYQENINTEDVRDVKRLSKEYKDVIIWHVIVEISFVIYVEVSGLMIMTVLISGINKQFVGSWEVL